MPYETAKQRRYMWAKHPEIAKRWEEKGHDYVKGERKSLKKPKHKKKSNPSGRTRS